MYTKVTDPAKGEAAELTDELAATPDGTRELYLTRAGAGYAKVRHLFVQTPPPNGRRGGSKPGMLPEFARNHRAAILFLLILTVWPWLEDSMPRPSGAWLRFLSSTEKGALTWSEQSLSHAWGTLEKLGLIENRTTVKRRLKIQPRREDSREPYEPPKGNGDPYLVLPHAFWRDGLYATLSWPALATLLILLKETGGKPTAELNIDRAQEFYGISRTTAETGLTELRQRQILQSSDRWVTDHDSGDGRRRASEHTLLGPFSTEARDQLRAEARARVTGPKPKAKTAKKEGGDDAQTDEPAP